MSKKRVIRLLICLVLIPILFFSVVIIVLSYKQNQLVQYAITHANKDIKGRVSLTGSHIAPFANFPMISIDLENLEIFESKDPNAGCLAQVKDAYIGFNIWEILSGELKIHKISLKQGHLDIKQHRDGTINIVNALSSTMPAKEVSEDLHLDLDAIELIEMDINKLNEATQLKFDVFIKKAKSAFKSNSHGIDFSLDSDLFMSVIQHNKPTFFNHKHVSFDTEFKFNKRNQHLEFQQTEVEFEKTLLDFKGDIVLSDDLDVDLKLRGHKPNFNLFLAFAPQDVASKMAQFDNNGKVYFNASVKGKTSNGNSPAIEVHFGCSKGMLHNTSTNKKMQDIGFTGYFSNGKKRDLSSSIFSIKGIKLKPELGKVNADLIIKNFEKPEIDLSMNALLDLDFLARFSKIKEIRGMGGKISLDLRFHDVIDLQNPESTLKSLNQAYYSKLNVSGFHGHISGMKHRIENLSLNAEAKGHGLKLTNCEIKLGNSNISLNGSLSDLPAIIHHSEIPIQFEFQVNSKHIDFNDFSNVQKSEQALDESISNLRMKGKFITSAKAFIESKNLPTGEFVISNFNGKLKHYPHAFHDIHLDLLVDEQDLTLKEFNGLIDHSDFKFNGKFHRYDFWFQPQLTGKGEVEFSLTSGQLILKELLSYGGKNHLPEEYRKEILKNVSFKGHAKIDFQHGNMAGGNLKLDKLSGKLDSHPLALHDFSGVIDLNSDVLVLHHFRGMVGQSDIDINGNYHLSNQKFRNKIDLRSNMMDLNALLSGHSSPQTLHGKEHDKAPSIFDTPFPNLDLKLDIQHFIYNDYNVHGVHLDAHFYEDHHIDVDHIKISTAEGSISGTAVFSGRDKNQIYFSPHLTIHHLNLDKLMLKFDNFGQDHLVSENLHGYAEGTISGKVHLHADLIPNLDKSDLEIKIQVTKGRLENYAPLIDLSNYFEDKDLRKVNFDTLSNVFKLKDGVLTIPEMIICSNLGFIKISGNQSISGKMPMQYRVGIPWIMLKDIARNKLFGRRKQELNSDEIVTANEQTKFVFVKIQGDLENYKVVLDRK